MPRLIQKFSYTKKWFKEKKALNLDKEAALASDLPRRQRELGKYVIDTFPVVQTDTPGETNIEYAITAFSVPNYDNFFKKLVANVGSAKAHELIDILEGNPQTKG